MTTRGYIDLRTLNVQNGEIDWIKSNPATAIDQILTAKRSGEGEIVSGVIRSVRVVQRETMRVLNGTGSGFYFTLDGYTVHVQHDGRTSVTARKS